MTLATALADLKASLDQGNEALTTKHFRLLIEALEALATDGTGDVTGVGWLTLASPSQLTVDAGIVTATQSYHTLDTEAAAATDDLDTINGASTGRLLTLKTVSGSRTVVVKDGTGNLRLEGDFSLTSITDTITLIGSGANWFELARSNNG